MRGWPLSLFDRQADVQTKNVVSTKPGLIAPPTIFGAAIPNENFQISVENHNAAAQAGEDGIEERVEAVELVPALTHVVVHRRQLFIRRLELFIHRLELLIGRLELFVRRLELLDGRL